jgi:hypothetical protein
MPHVEKEIFIGSQTAGLTLSGSECNSLAQMVVDFIGRATPQERESAPPREQLGPWPPFTCDHQIEEVNMHS